MRALYTAGGGEPGSATLGASVDERLRRHAQQTVWATLVALAVAACSEAPESGAASPLAAQGRRVYQNVCIACHAGDPKQDGAVGPAIAGSSRELLEARVLRGEYPPGYTPKRATSAMPRFEYLADQIDALAAYLAEASTAEAGAAAAPPPSS